MRRFKRHAARHRTLIQVNESNTTKSCPACKKEMKHKMGMVQRTKRARVLRIRRLTKAYNLKRGRDESAHVPEDVFNQLKQQAKYKHKEIHGSSVCPECQESDGQERVFSRDYAAARNIARCFHYIISNSGQRPEDLRARRDLSNDGQGGG